MRTVFAKADDVLLGQIRSVRRKSAYWKSWGIALPGFAVKSRRCPIKRVLNKPFFYYWICLPANSNTTRERWWAGSSSQAGFNKKDLYGSFTFAKPKAEQKRIVSILDEAFSAIAKAKENAEKNLLSARELFESYLNRVFTQQGPGWQEKLARSVCEFITAVSPSLRTIKSSGATTSLG